MIKLPEIILASGSPRRAEILNAVGWPFEKHVREVDESFIDGEDAEKYVVRLAEEKARAVSNEFPDKIILGADTTVVIGNEMLAKPIDLDDARRMLRMLAGRDHEVLTGVAIIRNGKALTGIERTVVHFNEMTEGEIELLVNKGSPLDKAGAYAVQAQAALFIKGIKGDYWNVVGLPINLVYRMVLNGSL